MEERRSEEGVEEEREGNKGRGEREGEEVGRRDEGE